MTTSPTSPSRPSRFEFGERAEPLRAGDGAPYACGYAWRHTAPAASLVLIHGLQSHAQWFAGAADELVARGLAVYALDRRGSGSSPGIRGDIARYQAWLDEVGAIVTVARAEHPDAPVHLIGHCFGANLAIGYALQQPSAVASVVLLTPGFYVIPDYTLLEKLGIGLFGLLRRQARFRVPQDDELFTRDPEVLAWIQADALGAKTLTARCLLQINSMLRRLRRDAARLQVPLLVLEAKRDRISDNRRNRALIEAARGERCRWVSYDAEHFLLAEPCRDRVIEDLASWVTSQERTS
ncbi:MAG: alpha/beta fold hydrolase [Dehalococcoidia bacterium]